MYIRPMLAELGAEPFDDPEWLFEPKWDGARLLLHKHGPYLDIYNRLGKNITANFPDLAATHGAIDASVAWLDGEGIVLRSGQHHMDDMLHRLRLGTRRKIEMAMHTHPATFIAFDLLHVDGRDCYQEPLLSRKQRLQKLVRPEQGTLAVTFFLEGTGVQLHRQTQASGMEGIVAKRKQSIYQPGLRSTDWLKLRHPRELDMFILGYRVEPQFALLCGVHFPTVPNKHIATVRTGIGPAEREAFLQAIRDVPVQQAGDTYWMEPTLCCRVEYRDLTELHQLLDTRLLHFLFNKSPADCTWAASKIPRAL